LVERIQKRKDILVLVFGEIDCRIHIYYQHMKRQRAVSTSYLIEETIENYGRVLNQLKGMGVNLIVHGITPAAWEENIYNYPYYGSRAVRAGISKEFNEKLKAYCEANDLRYFDIYSRVVDQDGMIQRGFSYDGVHLNDKAIDLFKEWMRSHGIQSD